MATDSRDSQSAAANGGEYQMTAQEAIADSINFEEYWEAFELFDKDGDGTISTGELKNLLRCFDVDLPDEKVEQLIKQYDSTEQGCIEFLSLVEIMKTISATQEMDHEIQEVYKLFAKDDQGVSADSLHSSINKLLALKHEFFEDGENQLVGESPDGQTLGQPDLPEAKKPPVTEISLQEAKWLLERYDNDEDERLNLEEFANIFMEKSSKFKKFYKLT